MQEKAHLKYLDKENPNTKQEAFLLLETLSYLVFSSNKNVTTYLLRLN